MTIERFPLRLLTALGVERSRIGRIAMTQKMWVHGQSDCETISAYARGYSLHMDSVLLDDGRIRIASLNLRSDEGDPLLSYQESDREGTITLYRTIPETMLVAICGRPLGDLITVRRARFRDVVVARAAARNDTTIITLRTGREKI